MNKKPLTVSAISLIIFLIAGMILSGCATTQSTKNTMYVVGAYGALTRGVYDGETTIGELKRHGDSALGTFNGLDGELVGLDGKYYQIGAQGKVAPANDSMTTPFTMATFLEADKTISVDKAMDYQQLQQYLDSQLPTRNIFCAMKIVGSFNYIKARSLTKVNKPYSATPYSTINQNEPTYEFRDVNSTMIGFWSPAYAGDICHPGYNFHFLTGDKKYGGHLLDCQISNAKIEIGYLTNLFVALPTTSDYYRVDFGKAE